MRKQLLALVAVRVPAVEDREEAEHRMPGIEWGTELEAALEQARRERKAVLFYFGKDP